MLKKTLAFAALIALSGCQSGATGVIATDLTDQLTGCVMEAVDQKGGSVVIKSPAQYSNFQSGVNKLGETSELCATDVVLPEIDFGEGVFVAQTVSNVCTLSDMIVDMNLEDEVLHVSFIKDPEGPLEVDCQDFTSGVLAAELSNIPEGTSIVVD